MHITFPQKYWKTSLTIVTATICLLPVPLGVILREASLNYFYFSSLFVFIVMTLTLAACYNFPEMVPVAPSKLGNVAELAILLMATYMISGMGFCIPLVPGYDFIPGACTFICGFMTILTVSKVDDLGL